MFQIAICDNEEMCRKELLTLAEGLPFPACCQCFSDGAGLLSACEGRRDAFDLVFMDIELADGESGIDLAAEVRSRLDHALLIFVTGYPRYITAALKTQPDQFLVKPVRTEEFQEAVNSAMLMRRRHKSLKKFTFQCRNGVLTFWQDEITCLEARDHYIQVSTTTSQPFLILSTMTQEEKRFLPHDFIKVHRSYLVNLRHIRRIEGRDIVLESGEHIPISKGYYQQVFDRYTTYASAVIGGLL